MEAQEAARARAGSYRLFGHLFIHGLSQDDWPLLQQLPELAPYLPEPFLPEPAAAAHHSLFGFNLLPYESLFLTPERLLGGEISDRLVREAAALQFATNDDVALDHFGQQLLLLAQLCAAEAAQVTPAGTKRWRAAQAAWLTDHLLRWLGPFIVALESQEELFYAQLGSLTRLLLAEHWQQLATAAAEPSWPAPPDLLADKSVSLKEIGRFLATPFHCGLYLSRADLFALGRQFQLPRGFGSREQLLSNLLYAAAQYEAVPALLGALQEQVAGARRRQAEWGQAWPALAPFLQPWLARLDNSARILDEIASEAAALSG